MKSIYFFSLISGIMLLSCNKDKKNIELREIPVDIEQNLSLSLSQIAENLTSIELELTEESPINPERIKRVLLCDNNLIITEFEKILVFETNGEFVRAIGSKGQGPGEYISIRNSAIDEINKRLFVNTTRKIICYDLDGNYLQEFSDIQEGGAIIDINYINSELLIIVEYMRREDKNGLYNHSTVYRLNNELQITDSCIIRNVYFEKPGFFRHNNEDFILNGNSTVYLYYSDIYYNEQNPAETVLRDTLYNLEKNHLVPELKLKFKNNGIDGSGKKFINLLSIYQSSRYLFAVYYNNINNFYNFCYDTKTGKGYNMQDGYTDDINQIEKPVIIRPFNSDTEMFYYLHTNMKPDDLEEPNPTLYIGRLKK